MSDHHRQPRHKIQITQAGIVDVPLFAAGGQESWTLKNEEATPIASA